MPNGRNIPDWVSAIAGLVVIVAGGIGLYGANLAETATLASHVEHNKTLSVSNAERLNTVDADINVLNTQVTVVTESLNAMQKSQEQFNESVVKLAEATDRLNISVARLEERIGNAKER